MGKTYKIRVEQRVLFRKNIFDIDIEDEIAKLTYKNEKVAAETYNAMKTQKKDIELVGNVLLDYYRGRSAREIFYSYIRDLDKGKANSGKLGSVNYEVLVKGG